MTPAQSGSPNEQYSAPVASAGSTRGGAGAPVLRIGFMGAALGLGNRGVSALSTSLMRLLLEAHPGAQLFMLLGCPKQKPFDVRIGTDRLEVPVVNYRVAPTTHLTENIFAIAFLSLVYRFVPIAGLRRAIRRHCAWIDAVAGAALIGDIRGGDSFSDIYGVGNFLIASLPVLTVIWIRGSVTLFPQTYGPFNHWISRRVAAYILRRGAPVISRDLEGIDAVKKIAGADTVVDFTPDVAFALDAAAPARPEIEPPMPATRPPLLVGLNVNGLMFNGGYTRKNMFGLKLDYPDFLRQLLPRLLAHESAHILLVPHTFSVPTDVESDPQASRELMKTVPESQRHRVHLVTPWYDQHELKGLIGGCDFFIGSRMHSCIAALSQNVPAVGVAYSKKFKGVFESVGAGDWIVDGRTADAASGVDFVMQMLERRRELAAELGRRTPEARRLLREAFRKIPVSTR